MPSIIVESSDTTMLNQNADHQLVTVKPFTKSDTHKTMSMLMTNKNKPSVKMVMGNVSNTNMGRTTALRKPNKTATIIAVKLLLMFTPAIK